MPNLKKDTILEVEIQKLAFTGKGIAKIDLENKKNFVIFVDGGIPGDYAKVILHKIKKNYAEAEMQELIKPSPLRISPKCKHFNECGGCVLQNLDYSDQLKFKEEHVRECLEKIGGLKDVNVKKIVGCDDIWNYRNKVEFSFGLSDDKKFVMGFHKKNRRYDLVDLKECHISPKNAALLAQRLKKIFKNIPPYFPRNNTGILRSLFVREAKNTGQYLVNLVVSGKDFLTSNYVDEIAWFAKENKIQDISIFLTEMNCKKGSRTEVIEHHLFGEKSLKEKLIVDDIDLNFEISPQAFFQPNTLQAQKLYKQVLDYADLKGKETVFDLYCGAGTISLFLAKKAKEVIGIEIVEAAIKNAQMNAKLNNISNIRFIAGAVEKKLDEVEAAPDLIVIDPPRAGISPKVLEKICEIKPKKIIYVSCNPSTFARDLKEFGKAGYKVDEIQPIDMLPHTYHIECVGSLEL